MTRSEFYRRAAEHYAHELAEADLTAQIDATIADNGQPGDDSDDLRRAAKTRLIDASDEWWSAGARSAGSTSESPG